MINENKTANKMAHMHRSLGYKRVIIRLVPTTFFLFIILLSSCNECSHEDCATDDFISIQVESYEETIYTFNIDFFYYDKDNQRIEAEIERAQHNNNIFYAFLDYRQEPIDHKYYLAVGDQNRSIEIKKKYLNTCCGSWLRFESVLVDEKIISLPIKVAVKNLN